MRQAIEFARKLDPGTEYSIHVGADGCRDQTAAVARSLGATVHEFKQQGKWKTLRTLVQSCAEADWVFLSDAGIEWPLDFLSKCLPYFHQSDLMGLAPTYDVTDDGVLERIHWIVERHFKSIEENAGGPVSIHGPTVAYRRVELADAFESLGPTNWINDDIVLPITMRSRNPECRIHYATDISTIDRFHAAPVKPVLEFRRRKRIVMGNIQWVRQVIAGSRDTVVSLLACRRIFRLFWAYWGLALALGVAFLLLPAGVTLGAVGITMLSALFIRLRRTASGEQGGLDKVLDAAAASLMAPYYLIASNPERTAWK